MRYLIILIFFALLQINAFSQLQPSTELPNILRFENGKEVKKIKNWPDRRQEILDIMTNNMYGSSPKLKPADVSFNVFEEDTKALNGLATRKQIAITIRHEGKSATFDMLLYVPNHLKKSAPAIIGLNFSGNHSVINDPQIKLTGAFVESGKNSDCVVNNQATEACRGKNAGLWPIKEILTKGYAIATIYREEVASDRKETAFQTGIHAIYPEYQNRPDNFATVAAWAWALSRGMDYLETDPSINTKKVTVFGFSRLGKAALWAGATDQRFAAVISNESGAGGGKQFRRHIGEDINRLCTVFPHWFSESFQGYKNQDETLPFDQHFVLALIAPRPVYLGTAVEDKNSDPEGEFTTALEADGVYKFLGTTGFPGITFPALNQPQVGQIGFHVRPGGHSVKPYDWEQYLQFLNTKLLNN